MEIDSQKIKDVTHIVKKLKKLIDDQASDGQLWDISCTIPRTSVFLQKAYLQQQLRKLHDVVEQFLDEVNLNQSEEK